MENEPNNENRSKYYVPIDGKEVYLGPDNSTIYLHTFEPHYDHIFLESETTEDDNRLGFFLWRLKHKKFDEMVEALTQLGTEIRQNTNASAQDRETFKRQGLEVPKIKEPELSKLTPRQDNLVNFMAYILLHEQLSAEDFAGEGDLYI
jgi:hypothetical protein